MVVELEANQTQIQRIIQSQAFRTSEVHRNLLQYLADKSLSGAADGLKEYTLGLDVFGKPASYDPRQESVVRMHVARLRQKLADYYRTEGSHDALIVDVPKGGFKVTFGTREMPVVPASETRQRPARRWSKVRFLAALLSAAAAGFLALGFMTWRRQPAAPGHAYDLQQLWGSILNTNRPLMICLATSNGSAGEGTASGAFLLGQFLAGRKDNVLLTRADQLAMPEMLMDNVVFLGPAWGNRQVEALTKSQPLVLEPDGIRNLNPRPGEPAFIPDRATGSSQDVEEAHSLISHVPGLYGNGDVLYLSGNRISSTLAAVRAVTDPAVASDLIAKMMSHNGTLPRFYQMVLRVQSMDSMPIQVSYMFHRDLTPPKKL